MTWMSYSKSMKIFWQIGSLLWKKRGKRRKKKRSPTSTLLLLPELPTTLAMSTASTTLSLSSLQALTLPLCRSPIASPLPRTVLLLLERKEPHPLKRIHMMLWKLISRIKLNSLLREMITAWALPSPRRRNSGKECHPSLTLLLSQG